MTNALPMPADTPEVTEARALDVAHVLAQLLQNAFGGLGAGVALAGILWLLHVPLDAYWRWPVGVAVILAGASTALRAYLDEARSWRSLRSWRASWEAIIDYLAQDVTDLELDVVDLTDERNALRAEVARLERENASLSYEWRRAQATPRTVQREDLVEPDVRRHARMIATRWAQTGKRPSRADMVPGELTRSQWDAAYGELVRAKLIGRSGPQPTESEMLHALATLWAEPVDYGRDGRAARPGLEVGAPGSPLPTGQGGQ